MKGYQKFCSGSRAQESSPIRLDISAGLYLVRRLQKRDLCSVHNIFDKSFDEPTAKRAKLNYEQYFRFKHDRDRVECNKYKNWISVEYYVVETKEEIVGTFGLYCMSWSPTSYWLGWIAILPVYRRRGIGTACLKIAEKMAAEKRARLFCLETSQLYEDAIKFYTSQSFKFCGKVDKYYGEREPIVVFAKKLSPH